MSIEIVQADEFRSTGRKVNQSYDMIRVTADMTKNEYYRLLAWIKKTEEI